MKNEPFATELEAEERADAFVEKFHKSRLAEMTLLVDDYVRALRKRGDYNEGIGRAIGGLSSNFSMILSNHASIEGTIRHMKAEIEKSRISNLKKEFNTVEDFIDIQKLVK